MIIDKQFMQEQFPYFNLENKVDLADGSNVSYGKWRVQKNLLVGAKK